MKRFVLGVVVALAVVAGIVYVFTGERAAARRRWA